MAKELATISTVDVPAVVAERGINAPAWNALRNSIYRGASDDMVLLAIDYCRARNLDPMKKPVHIVKTWDNDRREYVEAIWEGINSLRVTAMRTAQYAGQDAPRFGPVERQRLGSEDVEFPAWCEVVVHRLDRTNTARGYTGTARWLESYASKKDGTPNAMWRKRPWSQLAKCAEADALRRAFPEELSGEPTAEEMEGRGPDHAVDVTPSPAIDDSRAALRALQKTNTIHPEPPATEEQPALSLDAAIEPSPSGETTSPAEAGSAGIHPAAADQWIGVRDSLGRTAERGLKALEEHFRALDKPVQRAIRDEPWLADLKQFAADADATGPLRAG